MLLEARHLSKSAGVSIGHEHRIVAEAGTAARRPYQRAIGARLDFLEMIVGPGDPKRGNEMRSSLWRWRGASLLQNEFDPRHRAGAIDVAASPAPGEDSGRG